MKKTRKLFSTCLVAMAMVVALTMAVPTNVDAAAKIKLNKKTVTLAKTGKTTKLKLKNAKVTKKYKIKWKSSNKKVATVSSTGKVTAIKKGTCTITATYKGKKYTCKVKVKKTVKETVVTEKNIKISKTGIGFEKVGMTEVLTLVNAKPDASNKISWKSSNEKVATVTSDGEVTAIKKGSCTITATYKGKEYKCKVFVVKAGSTVSKVEYTKKGVKTTVELHNVDGHHIRWWSGNMAVATVETTRRDSEGFKIGTKAIITSVAPGRTYITAHDITVDTVWQNNKKVAEEQLALGNEWDWHLYGWTYYSDQGGPSTNPKSTECGYDIDITFYPECGYFRKAGWETEAELNPKYEASDGLPDFKKSVWIEVE